MSDADYTAIDWEQEVRKADPEKDKHPPAYEFSNGRQFDNNDEDGGPYN